MVHVLPKVPQHGGELPAGGRLRPLDQVERELPGVRQVLWGEARRAAVNLGVLCWHQAGEGHERLALARAAKVVAAAVHSPGQKRNNSALLIFFYFFFIGVFRMQQPSSLPSISVFHWKALKGSFDLSL